MAAMNYAKGDYVLGMDDDMQTHPSQIHKLIGKMEEGYDLVYGCYPKKKNSFLKNFSSLSSRRGGVHLFAEYRNRLLRVL